MEAGNNHYPRAYLEAPYRKEDILRISLRGEAKGERGMVTAWRVISLADEPGKLMEQNYLLYNLNESCKLADTSWIKPGTAMRETTISTPECLKMIDYCASMGISYMILDWGWYGLANSHKSDPSIVNVTNLQPDSRYLDIRDWICQKLLTMEKKKELVCSYMSIARAWNVMRIKYFLFIKNGE